MRKEAHEKGLSDNVHFLGERQDIADILTQLDIFVLCSRSEGLSITLLEAMAAGLPIVATAVGGNPDLITDGINGILVPSGDNRALAGAMLKILDDKHMARSLGEAAKRSYESRYTLDKMVERYIELFESDG